MFIQKIPLKLLNLRKKFKLVGLSFQKCLQTGSVKLDSPMNLTGDGVPGDVLPVQCEKQRII